MKEEKDQCIHHLVEDHAALTPDAVAITAPGRAPLTYGHLWRRIEETVDALNALGLGRNDRVAIVLPNGPEMAVAFLAVAAAATSAPLNPSYGASEFAFYLADLGARALLVQDGEASPAVSVARERGIPIITLSPLPDAAAGTFTLAGPPSAPADRGGFAAPDDVALVLHTSGTTARPKLVPLAHRNLRAGARNVRHALGLSERDRCLNIMPLFHVHGLMAALLASLSAGAAVVCTPGFLAPRFFAWMDESCPTWYTAVPTMHQAILSRAAANGETIAHRPLRLIRSCSAPLPPTVKAELERTFGAPVLEAYGMTEASHQMCCNPLPPGARKAGSVGLPVGIEVAIMDEAGNLMAQGATGEVVIHGPGVMGGYESNAAANAAAFVDGWFRTGDQGHLDDDGYLFITGRIKEIINRGGEKVAPREVDEALLLHPAVAQAVTFALPDARLGEDVAAAVVLRENAALSERALQEFAADRLAAFKVPRRIVFVDEIPKGPTGKPQRIGLAEKLGLEAAAEGQAAAPAAFVAPRTPLEQLLAGVWAEVLGIDRVGVHDHFLAQGGDSLLAMRAIARIRQALQVELTVSSFFATPTVAGLARTVEEILLDELERLDAEEARLLTLHENRP